jgi:hypothetical protein
MCELRVMCSAEMHEALTALCRMLEELVLKFDKRKEIKMRIY